MMLPPVAMYLPSGEMAPIWAGMSCRMIATTGSLVVFSYQVEMAQSTKEKGTSRTSPVAGGSIRIPV